VESADSRDEQNKVKVPRGNNTPFVLRQKLCGSGIGVPVGINAYQSKNENNFVGDKYFRGQYSRLSSTIFTLIPFIHPPDPSSSLGADRTADSIS